MSWRDFRRSVNIKRPKKNGLKLWFLIFAAQSLHPLPDMVTISNPYAPPPSSPQGTSQIPVYDSAGRITGYKSLTTSAGGTAYTNTSGGGYNPGILLKTPLLNGQPLNTLPATINSGGTPTTGSSAYSPGGLYPAGTTLGSITGLPATGTYANPSPGSAAATTGAATTATGASATNPNSQFQLLNQTKNPAIATAAANTLNQEQNLGNTETKNFNQYLTEAQQEQANQSADVAKDTTNLNALPATTAASLNTTNNQYATAANNANTNYQNLNANNAATVAGDVTALGNLDQQYVTNSQAALNNALSQTQGAINARSINPSGSAGNNSDYQAQSMAARAQANLGLQQNLSQMQINQLTGYVTPLQQQLYGQNVAQNQFATNVAQTIAGMQTGSAEQIAALTQAVAGRPAAEQQALLSSLSLPLSVQQQVMASLTSPLNALTSVDQQNEFYGLQTQYNGTPLNLTSYQTPTTGAYQPPIYANPSRNPAPNVQNGPQPMGAYANPATTGGVTTATGQPAPGSIPINYSAGGTPQNPAGYQFGTPAYYAAANGLAIQNQARQSGLVYDPTTGLMVDPANAYQNNYNTYSGGGGSGIVAGGVSYPAGDYSDPNSGE